MGGARAGSGRDSLIASRVLTVGDGITLEGVAWTKPSEVLGVWRDKLVPCDTDTHTHTVNTSCSYNTRGRRLRQPHLLFSLSSGSAGGLTSLWGEKGAEPS